MKRWLGLGSALYLPHLAEESLTGMHDDPMIVRALAPLANLSARHAAYAAFQLTVVVALAAGVLYSAGGRARAAVIAAFVVALLAESHHVVRALASLEYNSGLVTALPLPLLGLAALRTLGTPAREVVRS